MLQRIRTSFSVLIVLSVSSGCAIEGPADRNSHAPENAVLILDDRALDLLDPELGIEILGSGYLWTEGPLWVDSLDALLFSDIPNNVIHRYDPASGIIEFLRPSGATRLKDYDSLQGANGLLLDADGRLVLMQQGDRRVAAMAAALESPEAVFETLADAYEGLRFNSPNDGVMDKAGRIYFTDPPYGLGGGFDDEHRELDYLGVFRLDPDGTVTLLDDSLPAPNGIGLSPDQRTLYVAVSDDDRPEWYAYELREDGSVGTRRLFLSAAEFIRSTGAEGVPDGMAVHSSGHLFATGPGGVWLISAEGEVLARIRTGSLTANCALNADESALYMTAHERLLVLPLKVQ